MNIQSLYPHSILMSVECQLKVSSSALPSKTAPQESPYETPNKDDATFARVTSKNISAEHVTG